MLTKAIVKTSLVGMVFSLAVLMSFSTAIAEAPTASTERKVLKVCADPHYMPFSSQDQQGYENQLANLIAESLSATVEYTWFPQRMGFIRNTLRKETPEGDGYLCDLVMGVPDGYELVVTSKPYMSSTYALVMPAQGKLSGLSRPSDLLADKEATNQLNIGVTERSPGADWLAKHNLYLAMEAYVAQSGDAKQYPGQLLFEDLMAGKLDAAIVWGPTAAYFIRQAQTSDQPLKMLPLHSESDIRFHYAISTGVRRGESAWKDQINTILEQQQDKVRAILRDYQIPLVNEQGELAAALNDQSAQTAIQGVLKAGLDNLPQALAANANTPSTTETPETPETPVAESTKVTEVTPVYAEHVRCEGDNCKVDNFLMYGFRTFSQCQVCHGIDGTGSTIAPSLLDKMHELDYATFMDRVENGFQGQVGVMPPWKDNPNVMNNIENLYMYLKARADGVVPAGRPERFNP